MARFKARLIQAKTRIYLNIENSARDFLIDRRKGSQVCTKTIENLFLWEKKAKVQITEIPTEQNTAALNLGSGSEKLEREVAEILKPKEFQVLNVELRTESLALINLNHGVVERKIRYHDLRKVIWRNQT